MFLLPWEAFFVLNVFVFNDDTSVEYVKSEVYGNVLDVEKLRERTPNPSFIIPGQGIPD